jgi:hypothetical protein
MRGSRVLAFAAGCVLAAGCQAADTVQDEVLSFAPVPVSTLVSRRDVPFRVAHVLQEGKQTSVLARDGPDGKPVAVARIVSQSVSGRLRIAVQRLPAAVVGRDPNLLTVLTLEHLYALTMRMDPEARFCLAQGRSACDPARTGSSHAAFLRDLAHARQQAVAAAAGSLHAAPWDVVSMAPAAKGELEDQVSVRVMQGSKAMRGVTVFFHRAPHSSCSAITDAAGAATCELVDQHGDEEAHADEESAPVLVTYPGDVRAEGALLPTTLVLEHQP